MKQPDLFDQPIAEGFIEHDGESLRVKGLADFVFKVMDMEFAKKKRDTVLLQVAVAAGPEFNRRAREFIVEHLRANGPTPGEDITDAAKAAGITPPEGKGDRSFGPQYSSLAKAGVIVKDGYCQRRKGNATFGGIVWKLNTQKP